MSFLIDTDTCSAAVAETLGPEGSIAVQVHGGEGSWPAGTKCRWKNIRIKPL